jgi:hypothetical protein
MTPEEVQVAKTFVQVMAREYDTNPLGSLITAPYVNAPWLPSPEMPKVKGFWKW